MANTNIKQALKQSDYWTWFTEWLLSFGGKAAWPILIISTLYMGAELYPGVNLPAQLNFAVFLAQLFALDMGGMGLVSIARQVKDAGHEEEAKQADSFGKVLVAIVITSLVTVGVKQFLSGIPALTTPATKGGQDSIMDMYIDPAIMVVEFILVIARVVCAVLYGKVMHALKHTSESPTTPATPVVPTVDFEEILRNALEDFQTAFEQRLQAITDEQARMLAAIQHLQTTPTAPTVDTQAVIQAVVADLVPQFQAKFQALDHAIFRQNATIRETEIQANPLPELGHHSGKTLPEKAASIQAAKPQFRQPAQTTSRGSQAEQQVIRLIPANASRDELKAEAIRLHTVEGLSSYKIAEKLGKPAKTVQSWLSKEKDQAESGDIEVTN
jgi:hypothetical protein